MPFTDIEKESLKVIRDPDVMKCLVKVLYNGKPAAAVCMVENPYTLEITFTPVALLISDEVKANIDFYNYKGE